MSTKDLLDLATGKYDLHDVQLGVMTSVRRGGKIPQVWNIPAVVYQSFLVHRILVVLVPGQIGLFSPSVLRGKAEAGGLESLDRGSHTKLARLIPVQELRVLNTVRVASANPGARGSVVALRHSSGTEFTVNSLSVTLAQRIRTAVGSHGDP